jgi:hypothetical protein
MHVVLINLALFLAVRNALIIFFIIAGEDCCLNYS